MNSKKALHVLFIDDDTIERMKFERTVGTLSFPVKITETQNGEDALALLKAVEELPHLVVLDLNMPRISGVEFLEILKNDEVLRYLPALILTTSSNQKDLLDCYRIGVAGYLLKPLKYEVYEEKIRCALTYWNNVELIKT